MKKITGYLILTAMLVLSFSCNKKDEYVPAEREDGAQYFFPLGTETSYKINETVESLELTLKRVEKDSESSVIVEVTDTSKTFFESGLGELEAHFEAGSDEATISLPVDISKYEYGDLLGLDFDITEETTLYAPSYLHITVEYPEPWTSLGMGTITEKAIFGGKSAPVEILQNDLKPNVFRLVGPYDGLYQALGGKVEDMYERAEYLDLTVGKPGDKINNVTLTKDGLVFWQEVCTSLYNSDYSAYIYLDHPYEFGSMQDEEKWVHNCVLSYQDEGKLIPDTLPAQIQLAPMYYMYGVGAFNYSSYDGVCIISFPGVVVADFSCGVEYTGLFNKKDGSLEAVADVALGEDVEYVKVALVPGNVEDEYDSAYDDALELILSEEESEYVTVLKMSDTKLVTVVDEESEEEESFHVGEVRLPLPETTEFYSFVVVPFNADGEPQESDASYDVFQFKDFGISLTLADPETDADGNGHITATIGFGEDTESALVVMVPGKGEAAYYSAINLLLAGDDSVVAIDEPGDITFDIEGEGDFMILAASAAMGDLWNVDYGTFEYYAVDPWVSLGNALYREGFVSSWYEDVEALEYEVEILENSLAPGYYRLVNPYGEAYPYNDPGDYDTDKDYYLEIHAEDPEGVWIPLAQSNMHWGDGYFTMGSYAAYLMDYGYTLEELKGYGVTGTLVDGVITFPAGGLMIAEQNYNGGQLYRINGAGFRVTLPAANSGAPSLRFGVKKPRSIARKSTLPVEKSLSVKPAFSKTLKSCAVSVARGNVAARGKNAKPVPMAKR